MARKDRAGLQATATEIATGLGSMDALSCIPVLIQAHSLRSNYTNKAAKAFESSTCFLSHVSIRIDRYFLMSTVHARAFTEACFYLLSSSSFYYYTSSDVFVYSMLQR